VIEQAYGDVIRRKKNLDRIRHRLQRVLEWFVERELLGEAQKEKQRALRIDGRHW
jgi:hypothetical protein